MTTTKKRPTKGEAKVRNYLAFLQNPESILNQSVIAKAQRAYDRCEEPLELLDLYTALQRTKIPDGSKVEADFISAAKEWADAKGIDGNTFLEVHGISRIVLRDAGFKVRSGIYKSRVTSGEVQAYVLRINGVFEVAEVAEATDASIAGVRNVLKDMIKAGQIEVVTVPSNEENFRGRPPTRYQKV